MRELSLSELKKMILFIMKKFPNRDSVFYRLFLSSEVLRRIVGNEWTNQAIFYMHQNKPPQTDEARKYLRSEFENEYEQFQWQQRLEILAERIFNLQKINNFSRLIGEIQQKNFSSRFAEIEVGAHLKRAGISFEFVIPSNKKLEDFDITINDGILINCEVKQKLEETNLSKDTLDNTLNKAMKQLPKSEAALIALQIPEEWVKNLKLKEIVEKNTKKFFKKYNNLLAILFRWEIRDRYHPGAFYLMFRIEENTNSLYMVRGGKNLLSRLNNTKTGEWIKFLNLINSLK